MKQSPQKITLKDWDEHYKTLCRTGVTQPCYGGTLRRHVNDGDKRLLKLQFDNSAALQNQIEALVEMVFQRRQK